MASWWSANRAARRRRCAARAAWLAHWGPPEPDRMTPARSDTPAPHLSSADKSDKKYNIMFGYIVLAAYAGTRYAGYGSGNPSGTIAGGGAPERKYRGYGTRYHRHRAAEENCPRRA